MIPLRLAEVAEAVGGVLHDADPDTLLTGEAFLDTRAPVPGGLFVAFAGEHTDGHAYAVAAVGAGATAVLGSRPTGVPTVVVADPMVALADLARLVLARLPGLRVVGLTGSQGKTGTKDLLAAVLAGTGATVATAGNANNEWGVPLTVLRADATTRFLVVEMGARGIGHIAFLCAIARPHVAVVLNVGVAHIGEFGSRAAIAQAKGELVEALDDRGVAVLNADDPLVAAMALRTRGSVVTFGRDPEADVRLEGVSQDELGRPRFDLVHGSERAHVELRGLGAHQAVNAAAAAAVALSLQVPLPDVAERLGGAVAASRWRMELTERQDGLILVNDAYNANPDSMRAALETLAGIGQRTGRRTVAVLGEMRELGAASADEHAALGRLTHRLGIASVLVVGEAARPVFTALEEERGHDGSLQHVDTVDQASVWVRHNVSGSDVVLVKASRGDGLERVASALTDPDDETNGEEAQT